jgi:hypothetical protein
MSQLGYTQGSGSEIATDQGSTTGNHFQVVKLATSAPGSETAIPATVPDGLLVKISSTGATLPVSLAAVPAITGEVTADQGAPNTDANAWPVKLTDGTHEAHFTSVGGNYAQDVCLTESVAIQLTDGTNDFGAASGKVPLPVQNAPSISQIWRAHVTFGASESDITIYAPPSGKTAYIEGIIITPTAAGSLLKIYDQTNADAHMFYVGQPPLGSIPLLFPRPLALSVANNILRYATGSAAAGDITAFGYYA